MVTRAPLSVLEGSSNDALGQVLSFHFPEGGRILDPTAGERIMWGRHLAGFFDVTFHDVKYEDDPQDLFTLLDKHPEYKQAFDAVVYDPPYMIGVKDSNDPRAQDYGGYEHNEQELRRYMHAIHDPLSWLLKDEGKLIVKCSDQFMPKTHNFRLWHIDWAAMMIAAGFDIVDSYIYRYHRISPTAFQVKNRRSAVIVHTHFLVGQLRLRRPLGEKIPINFLA